MRVKITNPKVVFDLQLNRRVLNGYFYILIFLKETRI